MPNINNIPKSPAQQRPLIEAGQQLARIVQVIDLGLQTQRPFKGEEKGPAYEVYLTFEFPDQRIEIGGESKPMWKSTRFKLSSDDRSTCFKWYNRLDPKGLQGGEWTKLVDTPCIAFVAHAQGKGKNANRTFDNVTDVMAVMKGLTVAPLENPSVTFDLTKPNEDVFKAFPDWLQNVIKENLEYDGSKLQRMLEGTPTRITAAQEGSSKDDIDQERSETPEPVVDVAGENTDGDDW